MSRRRSDRGLRALVVLGTRPEAVKLAPVIAEIRSRERSSATVCATGQHREMLDQVLRIFRLSPDVDLGLMREDQRLSAISAGVLAAVDRVIGEVEPDVVIVQGDTASAMAASLAAFFSRVPVAHVEAGLRTGIRNSPFPEELMRRLVGQIAELHFAPTARSAENLRIERADLEGSVYLTGNTVVDAVRSITLSRMIATSKIERRAERLILLTAHRRENLGGPLVAICRAVRMIVDREPGVEVVYPVHLNPSVRQTVNSLLAGHPRIHLVDPLDYDQLVGLMNEAYLILTDSGGLQEEASVLGKPVVVLRRDTERPEAIEAGTAVLAGTETADIVGVVSHLLHDVAAYKQMSRAESPFGDGHAAQRIVDILEAWYEGDLQRVARYRWTGSSVLAPYHITAAN